MYSTQKALNSNSNPHPRDFPSLKQLIGLARGNENQRRRQNYEDRGAGTIQDGYTSKEEMGLITSYFMDLNSQIGLRSNIMFLLAHFCLMRGESVRMCELADLFALKLANEGFSECQALVVILNQGKTNQFGKKELGACLRNKEVSICPHSALALFLFSRWHIKNEPFPDMISSRSWFDIKLVPGRGGSTTEITYQTHLKCFKECFAALNINTKKITHINRGSGARMAELGGASEADIRRLGRWNTQAMEGCYLTSLPRGAMRTLAGFPQENGHYYIPRATHKPPDELLNQVFP